jgi:hypothetical protein
MKNQKPSVPETKSIFEIEIVGEKLNIFERAGDGQTVELISLLREYGLDLDTKVNSPCG